MLLMKDGSKVGSFIVTLTMVMHSLSDLHKQELGPVLASSFVLKDLPPLEVILEWASDNCERLRNQL